MPNPRKLTILTDVRRAAGVTLEQMAQACGFSGTKSRESVAAWERGQSVPRARLRPKMITYLGSTLGLRHNPTQFDQVWSVLVDEWGWEPVGEAEWLEHFPDLSTEAVPSGVSPPLVDPNPTVLAEARLLLAAMPTTGSPPPAASLPPRSRMPLPRNHLFTGRESDLLHLARACWSADGRMQTVAVTGIGGIGKTQLVCEFVHRYGQFFAGGIFWLSFEDPNTVPVQIAACGGLGHLALRDTFSSLPLHEQVALVRAAWHSPLPRLLVFDNCEDERLLARWHPTTGGCCVLITSRRPTWDATRGVAALHLDVLDRSASVTLLQKHLRRSLDVAYHLDRIAEELGDLPLALHLAGAYLARYHDVVSSDDYLLDLRAYTVIRHTSLTDAGLSPTEHEHHVARTFGLSLERLDPKDSIDRCARALLARAARFAPSEPIPRDLMFAAAMLLDDAHGSRLVAADALRRLVTLGLIEEGEEKTLRMHRLIALYVGDTLTDEAAMHDVERVILEAAQRLNQESDSRATLGLQTQLRFMTDGALPRADRAAAALAAALGHSLWATGQPADAQYYLEHALLIYEQTGQGDELEIAATLTVLALATQAYNQVRLALDYSERAQAIYEAHLGPDHPFTDAEVNNQGYTRMLLGDYRGAEAAFRRSLQARRRLFGLDSAETARVLSNLGLLRMKQGAFQDARRYLKLALTIREQRLPPLHLATAQTINNLGEVLFWQAAYMESWSCHQRALAIRRELHGEENYDTSESRYNLGRILYVQGKLAEAREQLEQAFAANNVAHTASGIDTAFILDSLGAVLRDVGELDEAEHNLQRALGIWDQIGGALHPERVSPLNNLALVHLARGNAAAAEACVDSALMICRERLGDTHPRMGETLALSGCLRRHARDYSGAGAAYRGALHIFQQRLGAGHPTLCSVMEALRQLEDGAEQGG